MDGSDIAIAAIAAVPATVAAGAAWKASHVSKRAAVKVKKLARKLAKRTFMKWEDFEKQQTEFRRRLDENERQMAELIKRK
jgi:hypothetical protein